MQNDGKILTTIHYEKDFSKTRISIDKEGTVTLIPEKDVNTLVEFCTGGTIDIKECCICTKLAKLRLNEDIQCKKCHRPNDRLWVCGELPLDHIFCETCVKAVHVERRLGTGELHIGA